MKRKVVSRAAVLAVLLCLALIPAWSQPTDDVPPLDAGHSGPVSSLAFSRDGGILYSISGKDSTLRSWDAASGAARTVKKVRGGDWGSYSDGAASKAVLYSKYDLTIIDLKTGDKIGGVSHSVSGPSIAAYAISPDWSLALTSERGGAAVLWDLKTGKQMIRKRVHPSEAVQSFAFIKGGAAALCNLGLPGSSVWNFSTGEVLDRVLKTWLSEIHPVPSASGTDIVLGVQYHKSIESWDILKGILENKPLRVLDTTGQDPVSMAVSSDGTLAACGFESGAVRVWRLTDGSPVAEWKTMDVNADAMAFSPDGKRLATSCGNGEIEIWEVASGRRAVLTERPAVSARADSADGRYMIKGTQEGILTLSETAGGAPRWSVPTKGKRPIALALSPKGDHVLAAFLDGSLVFLDGKDGGILSEMPPVSAAKVRRLELSEQGENALVLDASNGAALLQPRTRTVIRPVDKYDNITVAAFSPDGRIAAFGRADGGVDLYDPATGKYPENGRISNYSSKAAVSAIVFSPDAANLAYATADGKCNVHGIFSLKDYYGSKSLNAPVVSIHFDSGVLKPLFKAADGNSILVEIPFISHFTRVGALAFSADGKTLYSGGAEGSVLAWDWGSGKTTARYVANAQGVLALAATPDGTKLFSVGEEKMAVALALPSGKKTASYKGSLDRVDILSADGTRYYLAGMDSMEAIDLTTGTSLTEYNLFKDKYKKFKADEGGDPVAAALSTDGKTLFTAQELGVLYLWDIATGKSKKSWDAGKPVPQRLALAAGGKRLAAGYGDGKLLLWDPSAAKLVATLAQSGLAAAVLAFTPKGDILVSADSSGALVLWNAAKGTLLKKLGGHEKAVTALAVSADGKYLASAGQDGKISVWDLATGASLQTMTEPK